MQNFQKLRILYTTFRDTPLLTLWSIAFPTFLYVCTHVFYSLWQFFPFFLPLGFTADQGPMLGPQYTGNLDCYSCSVCSFPRIIHVSLSSLILVCVGNTCSSLFNGVADNGKIAGIPENKFVLCFSLNIFYQR